MRKPVPCVLPHALPAPVPQLIIPGGAQCYGLLARASHALAAWLITHFGQPRMTEDEAFLAQSVDHADCERRERWLDRYQRHGGYW